MSELQNMYKGRSGQLAVMAELLARCYNVAIPEVDRGDDIFVVEDGSDNIWRIQVKTAFAEGTRPAAIHVSVGENGSFVYDQPAGGAAAVQHG